jgi:uncharacterized protein YoxC
LSDITKNLDAIEATLQNVKQFLTVTQSDLRSALEEIEELTQQRDLLYNALIKVSQIQELHTARDLAHKALETIDGLTQHYQPKVGDKVTNDLDGEQYVIEKIEERREYGDIQLLGRVLTLKNSKAVAYVYDWEVTPVRSKDGT